MTASFKNTLKAILLVVYAALATANIFCEPIELMPGELTINQISSNVYAATHNFPWDSNSLIIVTKDRDVIFIDTPYTNEATEKVLNWVLKTFSPRVVKAIVTGYHIDNIGGIAFLEGKGIEVIGSKKTNELIRTQSDTTIKTLLTWLNKSTQQNYMRYYSQAKMVAVTTPIEIKGTYTYTLDNVSLELFFPGESHAQDNIAVYLSNENILFGSCIIKSMNSKNLGFTGDANMKNWPIAVQRIKERYPKASLVIPHHGKWGGPELIDHTLGLFQSE